MRLPIRRPQVFSSAEAERAGTAKSQNLGALENHSALVVNLGSSNVYIPVAA
jgi:hypothetical protein